MMTPALRQQQARTRMRASDIDMNREKIMAGVYEMGTLLRVSAPVFSNAQAILARISAAADSIERATLALEGYVEYGEKNVVVGDAVKRLTMHQSKKNQAGTRLGPNANSKGDRHELTV
ncbi:MAG: hypothetical protein AAF699_15650 [Pseudomonadota bacterium]